MTRIDIADLDPNSDSMLSTKLWMVLLIPILVCCYLLVTSTVSIFAEIPEWDQKRIAQFILLSIAFLTVLANPRLRSAFVSQLSRIPTLFGAGIVLFFALGVGSSVANADSVRGLIYSLVDVSLLGLLFLMALVVAACRAEAGPHFDRIAICLIALLGLGVGVQELTGYWVARAIGYPYSFDIALLHFSHPRMYNHLQTLTIPALTALPFIFPRNRLAATVCIMTLGMHWNLLLVTGARGSVVSLLVAFAVAALISPIARRAIIRWQSAGILLGILIYLAMLAGTEPSDVARLEAAPVPSVSATGIGQPSGATTSALNAPGSNAFYELSIGRPLLHTTGRTQLWRSAIAYASEQPLLGIGPMNFACKGPVGRVGSPHNLAFQILSEWGIPAAIVLAMFCFALIVRLFKDLRVQVDQVNANSALSVLLITAVLAALVDLTVSSLLIAPSSQVAAALIGGWLLGVSPRGQTNKKVISAVTWLVAAALCSLLLIPFAYHETVRMPSYREQLPDVEAGRPRLWQLGRACGNDVH